MASLSKIKVGTTEYDLKATYDSNGNQIVDTYVLKKGDTMTGTLNVPTINNYNTSTAVSIATGTHADSYFQSKKFRGQGTAGTYNHAIDFGYAGHNQVDFYEYGGIWNFWVNNQSTAVTDKATKLALTIGLDSLSNKSYTYTWPNKTGTFALTSDLDAKQNVLTAGDNITLDGATISAKDTTYTLEQVTGTNAQIFLRNRITSIAGPLITINDVAHATAADSATNVALTATGSGSDTITIQAGSATAASFTVSNVAMAAQAVNDQKGNAIDTTYATKASLSAVATSGSYNDLSDKPTITDTKNTAGVVLTTSGRIYPVGATRTISGQSTDAALQTYTTGIYFNANNLSITSGDLLPYYDNQFYLGSSSTAWKYGYIKEISGNAATATTLGTSSAGYTYTTLKSALDSCVMDGDTITLDGGSSTVNI